MRTNSQLIDSAPSTAHRSAPVPSRLAAVFFIVDVVLPVLIGAGIYSLWRSKTLLVFSWYQWAGLYTWLSTLRAHVAGMKHFIPSALLYSLPDALWVYSFTALLQYLWFEHPRCYERTCWTFLPAFLAVGAEIGQFFKIVPGTFDPLDILAYIAAWIVALISVGSLRTKANNYSTRKGGLA